jgi:hypothetical protein
LNLERDLEIGLVDQQLLLVPIYTVGRSAKDDLDDWGVGRTPADGSEVALPKPEQIETVRQG